MRIKEKFSLYSNVNDLHRDLEYLQRLGVIEIVENTEKIKVKLQIKEIEKAVSDLTQKLGVEAGTGLLVEYKERIDRALKKYFSVH